MKWLLLLLSCSVYGQVRLGTVEWQGRIVTYEVRGGLAVVEGDILLGPIEEISKERSSIVINFGGSQPRWTNATMYYTIDADVPNQQRILGAIAQWNERTQLKVLPRGSEANYVRFRRSTTLDAACSSFLGMRGGEQLIETTDVCELGSVVHEVGHAFGLLHEQQRADRNGNVTVLYQNIDKRFISNFETGGGVDAGFYDFGSIMHYPSSGFTRDGLTSLETVPVGIPIGQREGLSAGDIAAIESAYGFTSETTTITSVPAGLPVTVDGVVATTPVRVTWAAGSTHRLSAPSSIGVDPQYVLASWSDAGAAEHTVTASAATKVYCVNYQVRHRAAVGVASGGGTVSIAPRGDNGYYPDRSILRVKAEPAEGSIFSRWTGTTNFGANGQSVYTPEAALEVTLANLNYQATFVTAAAQTIETVPAGRTVVIDGVTYVSPVRMNWAPGSSHTMSVTARQPVGNNTVRHEFRQWEDGSSELSRTVSAGGEGTVYRATFQPKYLLTLGTVGSGTVRAEPSSADGYFDAGSTVQVTAVPGAGQSLLSWLGDLRGADSSVTVPMNEQKVITGYFVSGALRYRILHAGTYLTNGRWNGTGIVVAPGEIITVFGENIGPSGPLVTAQIVGGKLTTSLGGVTMTFDGIPAPLVYVSQNQLSAIVPYGINTSTLVRLSKDGVLIGGLGISVGASAPGLFTADSSGKGMVAALNQDGSFHSAANPAAPGSVIVLYATGAGLLQETLADGVVTGSTLVAPVLPVWVKVGKFSARVLYAGTAPGLVNGVLQVNVLLPEDLLPGEAIPIQLAVGPNASPMGTVIAVR